MSSSIVKILSRIHTKGSLIIQGNGRQLEGYVRLALMSRQNTLNDSNFRQLIPLTYALFSWYRRPFLFAINMYITCYGYCIIRHKDNAGRDAINRYRNTSMIININRHQILAFS